jgi:cysteinyl-tRNA synthetase
MTLLTGRDDSSGTVPSSDENTLGTVQISGTRLPLLGTGRIYVCGITPYDTTHLGHAATFVWADMAARILRLTGHPVEVCRNITDVDDHLLHQARVEGVPWKSLATQQSYRFEHDMDLLGVSHPAFEPRSHDHVDGVVVLAAELLTRGLAYERNGWVFFRGAAVHETAGLTREDATSLASERGGHPDDPNKDDPLDAALWMRSIRDEPAWPSPWGPGRPGWHAECTAMALTTFGATVDLHAGGADLAFPHHAYEAAQAEAFTGVHPFARSWMHIGTVMVGNTKMAKSTGNLVFVHDLLERWSAAAIRLLILSRPWNESWEFSESELDRAEGELETLRSLESKPGASDTAAREVRHVLLENLDIPGALAVARDAGGEVLRHFDRLIGLTTVEPWA